MSSSPGFQPPARGLKSGKNGTSPEEFKDDADLVEALVALGYSQRDAREMIQKIPKDINGRENRLKAAIRTTGK